MYYDSAEAGVGGIDYQDLTRQDVEEETTGMYWWRVLVVNTPRPSAPPLWDNVIDKSDSISRSNAVCV